MAELKIARSHKCFDHPAVGQVVENSNAGWPPASENEDDRRPDFGPDYTCL